MTRLATLATVAAQLSIAAFCLATAMLALLIYVPFSYQQFILPNVVPGVSAFIAWHPLLSRLGSDRISLAACLLSLAPVLIMAGVDAFRRPGPAMWRGAEDGEDRHLFDAALGSAIFISLTYLFIAALRTGAPAATVVASSVIAHLLLFGSLFLALLAARGLVTLAGGSSAHERGLVFVLATAAGTFVFKQIVFASVSFTGWTATAMALAFAASLAGLLASVIGRLRQLPRISASPLWPRAVGLVAIAATAWILSGQLARMDWNYLLQKLSAIAVWIAAFALFYGMRGRVRRTAVAWLLLAAAVPALAYRALDNVQARDAATRQTLDAHAGVDPSFKVLHDLVSFRAAAQGDFYDLLQQNSNIPREVRIDPVQVDLVTALAPRMAATPHVFIFVVDSLRQDYLSPYNPGVTFTPAIDALARDSAVFQRAITRYGATGLSEPSIWVGGLMLHKQYVMPFAPMNALDKLLSADGYQRFISRDTILRTIMPAGATDVDLDAGVQNMDYDLCRSLTDLRAKVIGRSRTDRPVFAYTQPQNVHIARITREGSSVPGGASYPGFHAPYAARIQQIDSCLGGFVQFLRDAGLYDDSLIVVTSDHGDSLGEGGRWGHAYTIFPEILRVPLVVHLPRAWQGQVTCDTDAVASLVDITPTLYYLLGHRPVISRPIFGRPLCTDTPRERLATRRDSYMVASSYGPVYGILRGNGRWLYIADGVNYTDYYYDLSGDPAGARNLVTPAVRAEYQELIREGIEQVNEFYRKSGGS